MLFSLRVAAKIKRRRGLAPDSPSGEGTATCRLGVVFLSVSDYVTYRIALFCNALIKAKEKP